MRFVPDFPVSQCDWVFESLFTTMLTRFLIETSSQQSEIPNTFDSDPQLLKLTIPQILHHSFVNNHCLHLKLAASASLAELQALTKSAALEQYQTAGFETSTTENHFSDRLTHLSRELSSNSLSDTSYLDLSLRRLLIVICSFPHLLAHPSIPIL